MNEQIQPELNASAPPAGWYPNRDGESQWWDGEKWGPKAPKEQPAAPQSPASQPPASQAATRAPGTYSVNGEKMWWDGFEWWKRNEIAELLLARTAKPRKAGWFTHPNGSVLWRDGDRWVSDDEITNILESSGSSRSTSGIGVPSPVTGQIRFGERTPGALGAVSLALAFIALIVIMTVDEGAALAIVIAVLAAVIGLIGVLRRRDRHHMGAAWGLALSLVLAFASAVNLDLESTGGSPRSDASSSAAPESAAPGPTAAEQLDAQMEEKGFHVWESGETWLKAAESGSFTCDSGTRCLWYTIVSASGCQSGFYVKADVKNDNGVAIGWTNEITASVPPHESAAFELRTYLDGSNMSISEVNCMG